MRAPGGVFLENSSNVFNALSGLYCCEYWDLLNLWPPNLKGGGF